MKRLSRFQRHQETELDFGVSPVGESVTRKLRVCNGGYHDIEVTVDCVLPSILRKHRFSPLLNDVASTECSDYLLEALIHLM